MDPMNTNRPMRRVSLRIGLPDERGPRVLGTIRAPGVNVTVTDPKVGASGTRAQVEPLDAPTADGMRWAVRWKGPNMTGEAVRYCRTLPDARAEAKRLRDNGP